MTRYVKEWECVALAHSLSCSRLVRCVTVCVTDLREQCLPLFIVYEHGVLLLGWLAQNGASCWHTNACIVREAEHRQHEHKRGLIGRRRLWGGFDIRCLGEYERHVRGQHAEKASTDPERTLPRLLCLTGQHRLHGWLFLLVRCPVVILLWMTVHPVGEGRRTNASMTTVNEVRVEGGILSHHHTRTHVGIMVHLRVQLAAYPVTRTAAQCRSAQCSSSTSTLKANTNTKEDGKSRIS